ncbi:MAG: tetratricopeptide repeat protein [Bdellovibrionia bacterium]
MKRKSIALSQENILFSWKRVWLGLLFLIAAVYAPSLSVPFHFDDEHTIHMNESLHHLSGIPKIWTDLTTSSYLPDNRNYRPLKNTIDTFCWTIGNGATWPFHLWKIFMHSVVCLCLFLIWRRLWRVPGWYPLTENVPGFLKSERIALVLAVIFAVHPVMTEVVTYISASSSLQCAMFYLLGYLSYLAWRDQGSSKFLAAALLSYAASCMSKEEGITLPAVIVLTEVFIAEGDWIQKAKCAIRRSWPFWLAFVGLAAFMAHMVPETNARSRGNVPPIEYFMTQWRAWIWYMRLWFWPWDLNADNVEFGFSSSIADPRVIQALIGNVLLLVAAFLYRKKFPALLFGLLWYYITISPASSILPLAEPVNERRMYLSYIGFTGGALVLMLWLFYDALSPKVSARQSFAVLSLIVVGSMVGTLNRINVWQTPENLWVDTVAKNPSSGRAQNNLALIYMQRAQYPQALEHLNRCEQAWPNYMYCALNKGIIGIATKDTDLAEKSLLRALTLDPESPWVNFQLGLFFHEFKKDIDRSIVFFSKSDALTGNRYLEAKEWLSRIYLEKGDKGKARSLASEILQIQPSRPSALHLLSQASN